MPIERLLALAAAVLAAACGSPDPVPVACPDAPTTAVAARTRIEAYAAAHSGNGGEDRDLNARTAAELTADPEAVCLLALCGDDERPAIPLLAWEHGGDDHPWQNPAASALVYCVHVPVVPSTVHWSYDPAADHVVADLSVRFPDDNPCAGEVGADQVAACIGAPGNFEILVDLASFADGAGAGLSLSEASSELRLVLADGSTVHLIDNL